MGCSPRGCKESDVTEQLGAHTHVHRRQEHKNSAQYEGTRNGLACTKKSAKLGTSTTRFLYV